MANIVELGDNNKLFVSNEINNVLSYVSIYDDHVTTLDFVIDDDIKIFGTYIGETEAKEKNIYTITYKIFSNNPLYDDISYIIGANDDITIMDDFSDQMYFRYVTMHRRIDMILIDICCTLSLQMFERFYVSVRENSKYNDIDTQERIKTAISNIINKYEDNKVKKRVN